MTVRPSIVRVAVAVPVRRLFDYLLPTEEPLPLPGVRVRVPFGHRSLVGVITEVCEHSEFTTGKLRPITRVLDREPLLSIKILALLKWAADYYHHPIGEVITTALPVVLRSREASDKAHSQVWKVTSLGAAAVASDIKRSPVQQRVLSALQGASDGLDARSLARLSGRWRLAVTALAERGFVSVHKQTSINVVTDHIAIPALTEQQGAAVQQICEATGFKPFLLNGVTGSGKTEVYLRAIEQALIRGHQSLVLVPEIGLTPHAGERFRQRFDVPMVVLHSGLTDRERTRAWLEARSGHARIVIGTRSAVFTPLPQLGLIVVDEEHDPSYKQQEGFRYSARDVAVMRANREGVPIVLGSATPSLETLNHARHRRYTELVLSDRAGGAELPAVDLLDMRRLAVEEGLSHPLRAAILDTVQRGEQALLFLNRRGFAPVWMCYACSWLAPCERCDARLTFHRASARLRCHHCGADRPLPPRCPTCGGTELRALGEGTERIESALARFLPDARVVRIDRDSTRAKGALQDKLDRVYRGDADVLVGTQMLSKGHDFPNVTLVGVLNADQGLYGSDFRATERLVQQIVQVSGRAGRAAKSGRVLIQTYHPNHPVFASLHTRGYENFVNYALAERQEAGYPPFGHLALLRAESPSAHAALIFLRAAQALAVPLARDSSVQVMDPVPSPMERRAGRYRAQLLVQAPRRTPLHIMLDRWLQLLENQKAARHVRWSLDVDPADLY